MRSIYLENKLSDISIAAYGRGPKVSAGGGTETSSYVPPEGFTKFNPGKINLAV